MYRILLSVLIILGFLLLYLSLRKLPVKDGIIVFLFASYIAIILGTIVVEENMLVYPLKLLKKQYFQSSIQFEMFLLPVICLYFYRTTFHSKILLIVFQSVIYSAVVTIIEQLLECYTPLIEYHTWTWAHTFVSVSLFLMSTRSFIELIRRTA